MINSCLLRSLILNHIQLTILCLCTCVYCIFVFAASSSAQSSKSSAIEPLNQFCQLLENQTCLWFKTQTEIRKSEQAWQSRWLHGYNVRGLTWVFWSCPQQLGQGWTYACGGGLVPDGLGYGTSPLSCREEDKREEYGVKEIRRAAEEIDETCGL